MKRGLSIVASGCVKRKDAIDEVPISFAGSFLSAIEVERNDNRLESLHHKLGLDCNYERGHASYHGGHKLGRE
jgi:hypothetical protein